MSVSCFSFILGDSAGAPERKSSLRENSIKSGCIRAEEIIPGRKFHQIRMNSGVGNHPCEKISSNQDAFGRRKSSLGGISIKSGCIWEEEIIPEREFRQIRMNLGGGNHPWEKIPSNQDAFGRRKSSLGGISIKSGCIPTEENSGTAGIPRKHRQPGTAGIR